MIVHNELSGRLGASAVQAGTINGLTIAPVPEPAHGPVVPRQLPPSGCFVGRAAETETITRLADTAGAVRIVVVAGLGGIGKTALAVHGLHQVADRLTGGQLYVHAGERPIPAVRNVLSGWLAALGLAPWTLPGDPGELAGLWRSMTATRPVGVLIDGAADAASVRALLPGAGLVIVTTRARLGALACLGATHVALTPLDIDIAIRLIRLLAPEHAESEHEGLARLAATCGGLPLALATAAGQLATRRSLTITRLCERLTDRRRAQSDHDDEENSVPIVLDEAYQGLPSGARRAYRMLAWHPGDAAFDAEIAVQMLEADREEAERRLDELTRVHLLHDLGAGRYEWLAPVREHARALAEREDTAEDRTAVQARVIVWYIHRAAAAVSTIRPRIRSFGEPFHRGVTAGPMLFADRASAWAWLRTHAPTLIAAQQAAAHLGLHALVWQITEALWVWLQADRDPGVWERVARTGVDAAHRTGDPALEARMLTLLIMAYRDRQDYETALELAYRMRRLAHRAGDRLSVASAGEHLGVVHHRLGELGIALTELTEAAAVCEQADDTNGRTLALTRLRIAEVLRDLRRYDEAHGELDRAALLFTDAGDQHFHGRTHLEHAETHLAAWRPDDAIIACRTAEQHLDPAHHFTTGHLQTLLAEAHLQNGDARNAERHCTNALAAYRTGGAADGHWTVRRAQRTVDRIQTQRRQP